MVKTNIQITSRNTNGKKITDTISYVNPEADNQDLVDFAERLIALTNNTYINTSKITTEAIG